MTEFAPGDRVTVRYESARTGNPQAVTADVVADRGGTARLKDESRNRTLYVRRADGVVETRERRGHMIRLGDLLGVEAEA